jgi:hypothetical protein
VACISFSLHGMDVISLLTEYANRQDLAQRCPGEREGGDAQLLRVSNELYLVQKKAEDSRCQLLCIGPIRITKLY